MKLKQIILLSALGFFTLLSSNLSFAEGATDSAKDKHDHKLCKHHAKNHGGQHRAKPKQGMKFMSEKLGLSEQQQTKITAIKKDKKAIIRSLLKQKLTLRKNFHQLDPQGSNFKKEIFALAKKKGDIARRLIIEKGEMRFLITSELTPEQLEKRKTLQSNRPKHQCKHHQQGGHDKHQDHHKNTHKKEAETKIMDKLQTPEKTIKPQAKEI